ncbi:hypothetical protein L5515_002527 [Caenorhabditis briggsae]|uniref:Uncharacterized protein n=1 Tax=Caenorhabditis briggsae TaxID=6238 RepID=A0AAE9E6R5_CAEBR|nr:hypothetical protein L5515_002527 [Caenorhabditis briggsae]
MRRKSPDENRETIPEEDKKEVTVEEMKKYREALSMRAAVQAFEEQSIRHKEQQMITKKCEGILCFNKEAERKEALELAGGPVRPPGAKRRIKGT